MPARLLRPTVPCLRGLHLSKFKFFFFPSVLPSIHASLDISQAAPL